MAKEKADAYIENLYRIAHEIVELMRSNGLTYSETDSVLQCARKEIIIQMEDSKI